MGSSSVDTELRLLVLASSSPISRAIPLDIILPKSDGRRPVARHLSPPDVVLRLSPDTVLLLPENALTLDRRPTLDRYGNGHERRLRLEERGDADAAAAAHLEHDEVAALHGRVAVPHPFALSR